ncbi:iron siderophore-binding protein [Aneurinibacillus danicus]|uniref:Iron siderophore-binding protein n=2 Tax=Aneurinibacillus group TaxID=85151 RepID=A0A511V844_9BACL|nr:iron siderophore-binding protein [Aneurinibacillus danicus]
MFATYARKKRNMFTFLAMLLAFAVFVAGCGSQQTVSEKGGEETKKEEATRTVKHAMGETKVPEHPQKVVILTNEGTEALLALGVKPVGAVKSWTGTDEPFYKHIAKDMEGVTVVGDEHQPNLEKIAALKPDLILGNKMRQEKIYQQLSAIAPTVFSEELRGAWKDNFKLYAEALNKKAEGDKLLADWDKRIADFKQKAGDKLSTKVSVVRFMTGKTRIYYKDTFSGIILNEIGFARPAAQDKDEFADEVTKERIPEMDGDILFYFTYETGDGQASQAEKEWTNDPLWKNLSVVKKGQAHKVDDVIWNTAGGIKAANLMLDDLEKYFLKQ